MDSVPEIWKPVNGHEGHYEVSDQGRVRSLDRYVPRRRGKPMRRVGKILKSIVAAGGPGYPIINLCGRTTYVHSLVLEAFVGPRPHRHEACHENGIRTDNRLANLRWDTPQANQMDRARHGTSNRGEQCAVAKLTAEQAREIYQSRERGCELAKRYGVTQQTICNLRKGRTWTHFTGASA